MMSLFDEEEISKMYVRSERQEAAKEAEERAAKEMHIPYEAILKYMPSLTIADLKKIEAAECKRAEGLLVHSFCFLCFGFGIKGTDSLRLQIYLCPIKFVHICADKVISSV